MALKTMLQCSGASPHHCNISSSTISTHLLLKKTSSWPLFINDSPHLKPPLRGGERAGAPRAPARPQRSGENECAQLASTLGKAWEMGQPASRAEGELREITRANGVVWREQLEARQATVKRRREETAAHTEQCLCTREGAITMLKQSIKLNHQLNEADKLLKIANIPISAPSKPAVAQ